MKKRIFSLLIFVSLTASVMAYNAALARYIKTDYSGKADSTNFVLIDQFMNTTKGTFWATPKGVNSSNTYIYWQQAHAIDVIIYAYERHKAAEQVEGGHKGIHRVGDLFVFHPRRDDAKVHGNGAELEGEDPPLVGAPTDIVCIKKLLVNLGQYQKDAE